LYAERLIAQNILSKEGDQELINDYREALDTGKHVAKSLVMEPNSELFVDWTPYLGHEYWSSEVPTSLPVAKLQELGNQLLRIPEGFEVQRQVQKVYQDRALMAAGGEPVNWGFAELLAYASLIDQGLPIRLTGQDVGRGTFSHRHAALHSQKDASTYVPLQHLSDDQPNFTIHDSFLSEEAVLAFEYGYATTAPSALVIWEAQFGDFANGAQVVIDQFITSGEHKWSRVCGLTMLLPHGYEGQGPEHSSARLERFLQLCAEHNIQVVIPSTPAQVFHMMRRQAMRMIRKPLVVMSPKSLLRHKEVTSTLDELANGRFECVLAETDNLDPAAVDRLVICSGKLYYELRAARRDNNLENVAIIRLEQLYPFPEEDMSRVLAPYTNLKEVVWAQEEPQNQGAWYSSQHHMRNVIAKHDKNLHLEYAGRSASASPAAGYMALHVKEQAHVVNSALGLE
jgi:2-oxoglutarate dehydrogenase E1 component